MLLVLFPDLVSHSADSQLRGFLHTICRLHQLDIKKLPGYVTLPTPWL
jgi:hypothetical protein